MRVNLIGDVCHDFYIYCIGFFRIFDQNSQVAFLASWHVDDADISIAHSYTFVRSVRHSGLMANFDLLRQPCSELVFA